MLGVTLGQLVIDVDATDRQHLVLHWRGTCNDRDPHVLLGPFFDRVLAEALRRKVGLHMHFERLGYFNSSTVSALLRFIDAADRSKLKLDLFYDAAKRWQGHNFEAIAALKRAGGHVNVHKVQLPA